MKNLVILIGNVGNDPEVTVFENGGKIAKINMATTKHWKDKTTGERKERTTWHNVQFGGPMAGVVEQYVKKGMLLNIDGEIDNYTYVDKEGVTKYATRINASNMKMLGGGPKKEESMDPMTGNAPDSPHVPGADDDDLPF